MSHVAVMGTGSWGTVFATVLADAGSDVVMWGRRQQVVDDINDGRNTEYLPDLSLPSTLSANVDAAQCLSGAQAVVLAVPSQTLRDNLAAWGGSLPPDVPLISLMKGVELGSMMRMSEVITDVTGVDPGRVVVVSGPNLAGELARRQPAASVVSCSDPDTAQTVAGLCAAAYFRPYTNTDVVGTELCGATKNVIALAVGMAEGMGYGDNTKATIITRGLAETTRLGLTLGGDVSTFMGLAGVGDLIATCMSPRSRNHSFGVRLGQGTPLQEIVDQTRQVAEGVKSCRSIQALARSVGVEMPIVDQVVAVVHEGQDVTQMGPRLLARDLRAEGV